MSLHKTPRKEPDDLDVISITSDDIYQVEEYIEKVTQRNNGKEDKKENNNVADTKPNKSSNKVNNVKINQEVGHSYAIPKGKSGNLYKISPIQNCHTLRT